MKKNFFSTNRSEHFNELNERIDAGAKITNKEYNVPLPKKWEKKYYIILANTNEQKHFAFVTKKKNTLTWKTLTGQVLKINVVAAWRQINLSPEEIKKVKEKKIFMTPGEIARFRTTFQNPDLQNEGSF